MHPTKTAVRTGSSVSPADRYGPLVTWFNINEVRYLMVNTNATALASLKQVPVRDGSSASHMPSEPLHNEENGALKQIPAQETSSAPPAPTEQGASVQDAAAPLRGSTAPIQAGK